MKKEEDIHRDSPEVCDSISEDRYFWNELHIIVEDGVNASIEEEK
ncbi:hypothetical protein [Bacillus pinisoli]|nr:hypothetical protein [Bacillus pinisoli]